MRAASQKIRLAMIRAEIGTNAELAQLCLMSKPTMDRVICGANATPIARRRVQNALGERFWPGVPLDLPAVATDTIDQDQS